MRMRRMTAAQAIVEYLIHEGVPYVLGILGHGNVQLGEALAERKDAIRFIPVKNEQNAVHIALGYARHTGRPLAVTTSIGPGATNMVTGAALGKVGRFPVLLLPGETFVDQGGPVLQQVEGNVDHDDTANAALKAVSVFFANVKAPEQLSYFLPRAFDAMAEPGQEGPATLCLPMDIQAKAFVFDVETLVQSRGVLPRTVPAIGAINEAALLLARARQPLVIAGGGVIRSGAWEEVRLLAHKFRIPVVHTQGGNGTLAWDDCYNFFSCGPSGSLCGNRLAREADVILGIGTRYDDFTTSSETLFRRDARFVNINVNARDAGKERAMKLHGDARETLRALLQVLERLEPADVFERRDGVLDQSRQALRLTWLKEVERLRTRDGTPMPQSTVIGLLNDFVADTDVIVAAAGSLPGDLLKLWNCKDPTRKQYHVEYDYSTMGYEIAGAIGVKLADPDRHVYALLGDGSFLMAPQELLTAVQEGIAITAIIFDNRGHRSIRGCQEGNGFQRFCTEYRMRNRKTGELDGDPLPYDIVKIVEGMGVAAVRAETAAAFTDALAWARSVVDQPTVIVVPVDAEQVVGNYEGWWDVPIPEVAERPEPWKARRQYEREKKRQVIR